MESPRRELPRQKVCVVGSGTWFLSGISYYTYFLTKCLSDRYDVSVILMRKLIPSRLYPGRDRVGRDITDLSTETLCPTFNGVDWFGIPSLFKAVRFLLRQKPDAIILEWWSASVVVWYAVLVGVAKARRMKVIIELHEEIDTGEAALPLIGKRLRWLLQQLCRAADAFVVHSEWDRERLSRSLRLPLDRVSVVVHGPYPMAGDNAGPDVATARSRPDSELTRLLFFGTIRPYKGLEVLVEAFDRLPRQSRTWKLDIVGETWEGWTLPLELVAASPFRRDIEVTNRYVSDTEVPGFFRPVDIVVLPYLRSSASGPLHIAMSAGLPVIVSAVGGLTEVADDYDGATMVEPGDVAGLTEAIVRVASQPSRRFVSGYDWTDVAAGFGLVLDALD